MIDERIEKVKEILEKDEAALVKSYTNRVYLSGFKSSDGAVIITKTGAFLFADSRYYEMACNRVKSLKVIKTVNFFAQVKEILESEKVKRVLIETDKVSVNAYSKMVSTLEGFKISNENALSEHIAKMRAVKSGEEIVFIKEAQGITDAAFSHILNKIDVGVTEREIALELEFFMRRQGSEGVAFDTIAVSGKNSSLPHGVPSERSLENGDFLTLDFGAVKNGYCSDMTRTVGIGSVSEKQRLIYDTVLKAQIAALTAIAPNKMCKDIDKTARDIIAYAGFGECFGHGLGHSVGLEIHESPCFNTRDESSLKAGTVITVEPGIYLEGEFGVRIEDMVLVTESGYENLTKSTKELIII